MEFKFVFMKTIDANKVNPIEVIQDICLPETYQFYRSQIDVLYDNNDQIYDNGNKNEPSLYSHLLNMDKKYLIQFIETGDFGYWENGNTHFFSTIIENSVAIETDIYHFFYMQYSV